MCGCNCCEVKWQLEQARKQIASQERRLECRQEQEYIASNSKEYYAALYEIAELKQDICEKDYQISLQCQLLEKQRKQNHGWFSNPERSES